MCCILILSTVLATGIPAQACDMAGHTWEHMWHTADNQVQLVGCAWTLTRTGQLCSSVTWRAVGSASLSGTGATAPLHKFIKTHYERYSQPCSNFLCYIKMIISRTQALSREEEINFHYFWGLFDFECLRFFSSWLFCVCELWLRYCVNHSLLLKTPEKLKDELLNLQTNDLHCISGMFWPGAVLTLGPAGIIWISQGQKPVLL